MKKSGLILISLLFVVLLSVVVVAEEGLTDTLKVAGLAVLNFFKFEWLFGFEWLNGSEASLVAFVRILLFLAVFALFYLGTQALKLGRAGTVVALLMSFIAALFIPPEIVLLIGVVYSSVAAWGLIIAMLALVAGVVYWIPADAEYAWLRIGLLVVLFFLLRSVYMYTRFVSTGGVTLVRGGQ
ncbi:MAG TPA: hypothetical protein VJH88_06330 [Candidatus Nanoarchaeia archaeon]|nr:hypothetical protein [Candidatus Nanoarchaeia archaeon]